MIDAWSRLPDRVRQTVALLCAAQRADGNRRFAYLGRRGDAEDRDGHCDEFGRDLPGGGRGAADWGRRLLRPAARRAPHHVRLPLVAASCRIELADGRAGALPSDKGRCNRETKQDHYTHLRVEDLGGAVANLPGLTRSRVKVETLRATGTDGAAGPVPNVLPAGLPEHPAEKCISVPFLASKTEAEGGAEAGAETTENPAENSVFPGSFVD